MLRILKSMPEAWRRALALVHCWNMRSLAGRALFVETVRELVYV